VSLEPAAAELEAEYRQRGAAMARLFSELATADRRHLARIVGMLDRRLRDSD
jgi:hypothetical protein